MFLFAYVSALWCPLPGEDGHGGGCAGHGLWPAVREMKNMENDGSVMVKSCNFAAEKIIFTMKSRFLASIRRHWLLLAVTVVLSVMAGWTAWNVWPFDRTDMLQSTCRIDGEALLCLRTGKDSLLLNRTPTHRQGVWVNRHWWAPSGQGRLITSEPVVPFFKRYGWPAGQKELRERLAAVTDSLRTVLHRREIESKELAYYLRTHGVQDEGYGRIAQYATEQKRQTDTLSKLVKALEAIPENASLKLYMVEHDTVVWRDADGVVTRSVCEPRVWDGHDAGPEGKAETGGARPVWLRTVSHTTPSDVRAVSLFPWTLRSREREALTAVLLPHDTLLVDSWLRRRHLLQPRLFAPDGAPVFTRHGYCLGMAVGKEVVR